VIDALIAIGCIIFVFAMMAFWLGFVSLMVWGADLILDFFEKGKR